MKGLLKRWHTDKNFRREIALYAGALVNFFFVGFEFYGGVKYQSIWFIALAVYYLVLTVVKLYIGISAHKKVGASQWKTLKVAGIVMIVINLALFVMISIMIAEPSISLRGYSKVVAIAMAAWTFYLFITAIKGLAELRGKRDAWLLAGGIVKLIGAIVSVLMLQTAMIASFGTKSGEDLIGNAIEAVDRASGTIELPIDGERIMSDKTLNFLAGANRATGIMVGFLVMGLTIYMVTRGVREEKLLK